MKKLGLLVVCFLLVPGAFCEEQFIKEVYNKWTISGTYNTSENDNFYININDVTNKSLILMDNQTVIVTTGNCGSIGDISFCVDDINDSEIFNMTFFKFEPEVKLRIERLIPGMCVERVFPKATLQLGEEMKVKLEFGNNGIKSATDLEVRNPFPEQFIEILSVEGCDIEENKVVWRGVLEPHSDVKCWFTLKGIASGKFETKAEMFYFDGVQNVRKEHRQVLTVLGSLVEFTTELDIENVSMKDEGIFTVNINPKAELDRFSLAVLLPDGVAVVDIPEYFSLFEGRYVLNRIPDTATQYNFSLRFDFQGKRDIITKIDYEIRGVDNREENIFDITVTGSRPYACAIVPTVKEGIGEFLIVNPSPSSFNRVSVKYTIGGQSYEEGFEWLEKMEHKPVRFTHQGSENFSVAVSLDFFTETGQELSSEFELMFNVSKETPSVQTTPGGTEDQGSDEGEKKDTNTLFITLIAIAILIGFGILIKVMRKTLE